MMTPEIHPSDPSDVIIVFGEPLVFGTTEQKIPNILINFKK